MEFFKLFQLELLKILGIICIVLGLFSTVVKFRSVRMKKAIVGLEFGAGIMLVSDMASYIYDGDSSKFGYWTERITCFIPFFMICFEVYAFSAFIASNILGRGKLRKPPKSLLACYMISAAGMLMSVIANFTGLYYTFDVANNYQRAPLFLISFIFPVTVIAIQLSLVIRYKSFFDPGVWFCSVTFLVLPLVGGVLQLFSFGISPICLMTGVSAVIFYICSLVCHNNLIIKTANTDAMTDLPNQYGFLERVEALKAKHGIIKYNSYYFDIVRMGQYNRRYGTDAGDIIIQKYAAYIEDHINEDEILARLGGNFFVALIRRENEGRFLEMLQGVPVEIEFAGEKKKLSVAAVAGGFEIKDNSLISELVIGNASIAGNIAKNIAKKPFVKLTDKLLEELNETRQLEERIPAAFKNEEFVPYYQPKVNSETMELCGAEALARWEHDGTVIPPFKFVPIMERNDSICRLDFYILEHVCMDIVSWLEKGMTPPTISVNFSRKNLGNPILAEEIYNVVKKYNVPDNLIQIEITETLDEFPLDYLKGVVEALQRYGLTVAIDDFGTGSSSINLLREISFDVLKIDRQFIECSTQKEQKLLEHIIEIAGDIESGVIAEGVETTEQLWMLKKFGCTEIQGYIFDRPLTREIFEERMLAGKYSIPEKNS